MRVDSRSLGAVAVPKEPTHRLVIAIQSVTTSAEGVRLYSAPAERTLSGQRPEEYWRLWTGCTSAIERS